MTPQEEKYVIAAQGEALNLAINALAESRATKELLVLLADKILTFPEENSAASHWKSCFDAAFAQLSHQTEQKIAEQIH
jgi:hypothetical protein